MIIRIGERKIFAIPRIGFLEFFLPIYSILIYYTLPIGGSIGQIILFSYTIIYIMLHRNIKYKIPKWLFVFTLFIIPVQLAVFNQIGGFNSSRLVNLLMIIVYLMLLSIFKVDIDGLMYVYKVIAAVASLLIIVQFIQIYFGGQVVHQIMLFSFERSELWYQEGLRPQGLFPEPQAYATFILPLLVLCLMKKEYAWSLFLTFSILLSTSTLGMICSLGVWSIYVLTSTISLKKKIIVIVILLAVVACVITLPIFDYTMQKLLRTDFLHNVRLTRGFTIYTQLPWDNKIFGIGVNNLEYCQEVGLIELNDYISRVMRNPSYITTASELLINYGLIAAIIYAGMLINFFKNSELRLMVVLLFVLSFAQTILFSGVWFLFVIIIVSTLREEGNAFLQLSNEGRI